MTRIIDHYFVLQLASILFVATCYAESKINNSGLFSRIIDSIQVLPSKEKYPYYIKLDIGVSLPKSITPTHHIYDKNHFLAKGASCGVGVGYNISNYNMRADLSLTARTPYRYMKSVQETMLGEIIEKTTEHNITSLNAITNLYYDLQISDLFSVYFSAGIGLSMLKSGTLNYTEQYIVTTTKPTDPIPMHSKKSSKLNSAWSLGVGHITKLSDNYSIAISYKYIDHGMTSKTNLIDTQTNTNLKSLYGINIKSHELSLSMITKF